MLHLDYRDTRPIYTQIADGLRSQILTGILAEGDKLPSVRELAGELTINPNTIQRAYRELESEGFIVTVPGKGCFVCALPQNSTRQQELLGIFDSAAKELLALGISREALTARLQGGNDHA